MHTIASLCGVRLQLAKCKGKGQGLKTPNSTLPASEVHLTHVHDDHLEKTHVNACCCTYLVCVLRVYAITLNATHTANSNH